MGYCEYCEKETDNFTIGIFGMHISRRVYECDTCKWRSYEEKERIKDFRRQERQRRIMENRFGNED